MAQIVNPTSLPEVTEATDNTQRTTMSASAVLVTGLTLTPAAGTYLARFTGSAINGTAMANGFVEVFAGGIEAKEVQVTGGAGGSANEHNGFCIEALVTVDGSQAIEARFRSDGTNSLSVIGSHTLTITKVKA